MLFRVMRTWVVGFSFSAASLCAGCSLSPATHGNGLPRISRYTNPLQLEWALSRYSDVAGSSATNSQALVRQACEGWRQMTFDLASARQYPLMLRMSAEASGLLAAIDELPAAMGRHPLPSSCLPPPESSPVVAPTAMVPPSVQTPAAPTGLLVQADAPSATPGPAVTAVGAASAMPATDTAPVPGPAAQNPWPSPAPMVTPPAAPPAAVVVEQTLPRTTAPGRRPKESADEAQDLWDRLIAASGVGTTAAELTSGRPGAANLQELSALADSSFPAIRLRARFHLLGQCARAIATTERLGQSESAAPYCIGRKGNEPLRVTQSRLLHSMLSAWRGRGPEPLSDSIVALASFAARDNPVLDGPRIGR